MFIGYILFDTQMIIERADRGDYDYIKHSLDLFVDLIGLFVRLLIIAVSNIPIMRLLLHHNFKCGIFCTLDYGHLVLQAKNSGKSKSDREREERRRKGNTTFR